MIENGGVFFVDWFCGFEEKDCGEEARAFEENISEIMWNIRARKGDEWMLHQVLPYTSFSKKFNI